MRWGCERDAALPLTVDGEDIFRCPRRPILEEPVYFSAVFRAYGDYQRGILPENGGVLDQPARLLQSFRVIDEAAADCRRAREGAAPPPQSQMKGAPPRAGGPRR